MSITWLFERNKSSGSTPRISGKKVIINKQLLSLDNPWVSDSVFMAKLYTASILFMATFIYPRILTTPFHETILRDPTLLAFDLFTPFIFTPFLLYRIWFIKRLSNFYFNRETRKIYYQCGRKLIVFNWSDVNGGLFKRREFGGSCFTTSYALAFAPRRKDGSLHRDDCLWVDSNVPTEPDIQYVAEVWEYLSHFMEHGPANLPPPGESNWWHTPMHAICLTPAEAWRHYAPWRTGEPGEMQGKKNWQLPFWAVLFPYNFSLAVCWYIICRLFNVKAAPVPSEALVGQ